MCSVRPAGAVWDWGFSINKIGFGNEMIVCLRPLKLRKYQAILRVFGLIILVSLSCCCKRSRRIIVGNILIVFGC